MAFPNKPHIGSFRRKKKNKTKQKQQQQQQQQRNRANSMLQGQANCPPSSLKRRLFSFTKIQEQ